jgi:hypothetical protein
MANPLDYNINSIVKGVNGFGRKPPASGSTFSITLAGATVKTLTVPSSSAMGTINAANTSSFLAIFGYAAATEFWVSVNGTAAVPVGANFAASTSELLPGAYVVKAGDVIQAISTAGGDMSVSFYAIPDA